MFACNDCRRKYLEGAVTSVLPCFLVQESSHSGAIWFYILKTVTKWEQKKLIEEITALDDIWVFPLVLKITPNSCPSHSSTQKYAFFCDLKSNFFSRLHCLKFSLPYLVFCWPLRFPFDILNFSFPDFLKFEFLFFSKFYFHIQVLNCFIYLLPLCVCVSTDFFKGFIWAAATLCFSWSAVVGL